MTKSRKKALLEHLGLYCSIVCNIMSLPAKRHFCIYTKLRNFDDQFLPMTSSKELSFDVFVGVDVHHNPNNNAARNMVIDLFSSLFPIFL